MTSPEQITHTFCQICEQSCGLTVTSRDGRIVSIAPDQQNKGSWRDFCIKAAHADQVVSGEKRIRQPMRRVGDRYVAATYDEALDDIAGRMRRIIDAHGPDAVGSYLGNPAYVAFAGSAFFGALLDALGTDSRYTVGSLDQNAWNVVSQAMFGTPWIPLLPDVDGSDCMLFVGANPAISMMNWVGRVADGWRRALKQVAAGAELIIVDPRRTESARKATLHIAPRPEEDWALLLAMLKLIFEWKLERPARLDQFTGLDKLREMTQSVPLDALAQRCDVAVATIIDAAGRFGRAAHPLAVARTGSAIGRNGVLTEWLSHVLNFVMGQVDVPGGRYMPGWPINFPELLDRSAYVSDKPSRVRGLMPVAGAHSVAELPQAIRTPGPGQVRALIMYAGNPVVSGPDGPALDQAFAELELMVSVDLFQRESHRHAHWLIPAVHFLERDELNVPAFALTERPFIQVTRPAVEPPAGVEHEWQFFMALGKRLGLKMFGGMPDPTPQGMARQLLGAYGQVDYDAVLAAPHGLEYGERSYGHFWRYLEKNDRRVNLAPPELVGLLSERLREPLPGSAMDAYPFQMISRRRKNMMNSWLAETTGMETHDHRGDMVEIGTDDAAALGLVNGDRASVASRTGEVEATVIVSDALRQGVVVMDHGWGSRLFDPASGEVRFEAGVNRNRLVANDDLAPLSGVPRLNGTPVKLRKLSTTNAAA